MAIEIERKFLVNLAEWAKVDKGKGELYQQGYLLSSPDKTIRVRLAGQGAYLTIKGKSTGISRAEYEFAIPLAEARELLEHLTENRLEKIRYRVPVGKHVWEVDEFLGANQGLVLAEVELADEAAAFLLPDWAGKEVSDDPRYFNAYLAKHPWGSWQLHG